MAKFNRAEPCSSEIRRAFANAASTIFGDFQAKGLIGSGGA